MPLTIVVPSIGRKTLLRTVNSIDKQTLKTEMLLDFDGGHEGQATLRNRAIQATKTSWVGFCDDDDWLDIHYHEWLKQESTNRHADMVIFQMQRQDGMILPGHQDINLLTYNWVGISFALRTKIAKQYPFANIIGEDFDLIQRVLRAGLRVVIDPRVAYWVG